MRDLSDLDIEIAEALISPRRISYEEGLPVFIDDEKEFLGWQKLDDLVDSDPLRALMLVRYIGENRTESTNIDLLVSGPLENLLKKTDSRLRAEILKYAADSQDFLARRVQ